MRRLPRGATWLDAVYKPAKVRRLRRREREEDQGPGFSQAAFERLARRYDNRCVCCGKRKKLGPDHIIPLARGGAHHISNIQPLCRDCNFRKRTDIRDYRPDNVQAWLRQLRGRCQWGAMLRDRQCKNLAAIDASDRLCAVHHRVAERSIDV